MQLLDLYNITLNMQPGIYIMHNTMVVEEAWGKWPLGKKIIKKKTRFRGKKLKRGKEN